MNATRVFVIFGLESKIIRQILVSDEITKQPSAPDKCAILEVPFTEYSAANDAALRSYVAAKIGKPAHSGRCVEVDDKGFVVAAYFADPLIDVPIRGEKNTIEPHERADVGDVKVGTRFVPIGSK
jgi:hypothetical protein